MAPLGPPAPAQTPLFGHGVAPPGHRPWPWAWGGSSPPPSLLLDACCKEIEENNRMGKTRDLFKKIRATKGRFHAKMETIKDRNGMDLTEAEDIKKRWQEYTVEPYQKNLHYPNNHDGMITHLVSDTLDY